MSLLLDGKALSDLIKKSLKEEVEEIKIKYGKTPKLAVLLIGDNPASKIYVRNKEKACAKVGIDSLVVNLDKNVTEKEAINELKKMVNDNTVTGILVQLPVPKQIDSSRLIELIPWYKDVDGLTDKNVSSLIQNKEGLRPCTPLGVMDILSNYNIDVLGKNVVIVGRSMLVGKPLSQLMTNANATVTLCHTKTKNLSEITKRADIVVCACGVPKVLTKDMVKEDTVVIDVGINRIDSFIVGDADFENIKDIVSAITPVPGGCGPMTIAELLKNTIKCFKIQND